MKKPLTIGRSEDNDIVISQPQVSGRHAVVELLHRNPPRFTLRDLSTTNGTFKNKERIDECEVSMDDEILVANVPLSLATCLSMFDASGNDRHAVSSSNERGRHYLRRAGVSEVLRRADSILVLMRHYVPFMAFLVLTLLIYGAASPGRAFRSRVVDGIDIEWVPLIGSLIAAALLVQLSLSLLARNRRLAYDREQQDLTLRLWRMRVEDAQHRRAIETERKLAGWNGVRKFEVAHKVQEGGGVCSFYLISHDGQLLAVLKPGQYLTFSLTIPGHAQTVIRCYSISSSAAKKDYYRVSIKRALPPRNQATLPSGLSSSFFHDVIQEGDILDVRAPAGHFFLDMTDEWPIVLIGGGIGITPMLSMLDSIIDYGQRRETWLFYGVRNRKEHIMAEHLRWVNSEFPNIRIHVCYSHPGEDDVQGVHYDYPERISVDMMERLLPSNNYHFYVCGPQPMMESITSGLQAWGVPSAHVHFEAFGPASVKRASRETTTEKLANDECMVEFAKTGKTCRWNPGSGSLLDLAEANGITIASGCRAGSCGTCEVAIREGNVEYLHEPDIESEERACLACVARPVVGANKNCLVLDA